MQDGDRHVPLGLRLIRGRFQVGRTVPTSSNQDEAGDWSARGGRRALTREETIQWLEGNKADLEKEQGVNERIEELNQ